VTSGLPQGTVLGPTLFLGFVNDIGVDVKSKIRLFADDCILYESIRTKADEQKLQSALNTIQNWADVNGMKLNGSKTTVISFSRKRNVIDTKYSLKGTDLQKSKTCKYLGLTFQDNLKWDSHITNTVSNAKKRLHFVMRNLKGSLPKTKEHAYLCLIRPLLEYCSRVWDPHSYQLIASINSVQSKAARHVTGEHRRWCKKKKSPYISITKVTKGLKWEALETRRKKNILRSLHKAAVKIPAWGEVTRKLTRPKFLGRRDHDMKMALPRYNTNIGRHSFLGRAIRLWNALPAELQPIPWEVKKFKMLIKTMVQPPDKIL
jgi:hypothetical protein